MEAAAALTAQGAGSVGGCSGDEFYAASDATVQNAETFDAVYPDGFDKKNSTDDGEIDSDRQRDDGAIDGTYGRYEPPERTKRHEPPGSDETGTAKRNEPRENNRRGNKRIASNQTG